MKWLIITGDDFGMSPGINLGIIEAHHCGMLTSASLLVNRPASEAATALARECPVLSLGLHLELATDDPEGVHAQIERQVARFLELVGALPTHLDSHHNVHHEQQVLPHVLAWARRSAVPVRGHSAIRQREIELIGFRDLPGLAKSGLSHPGDRAPRWREVLGR